MTQSESDPFHDFTVPQDADFVASPTPNAEDEETSDETGDGAGKKSDRELDDDPLGTDRG